MTNHQDRRLTMDPIATGDLVEMQVKHSKKHLLRILIVAACVGLALYLWSGIPWSEIMPVKSVQVAGRFVHLSPAELEKKAANIIRGGFVTVNIAGVKRELLKEAWINEVAIRRVWPDSLMIFITEHEPVALWGSNALISAEAAVFSPEEASFPPGLPFLSGPQSSEEAVLEKYKLLKTELKRWDMEVEMLVLTERRAWQFKLADGPVVLLGRKDVEARFKRFFSFAVPYQADSLLQAKSVDMRYTNGFAVKWTTG